MHGFWAVFRKEMSNFFVSPIAYSIIAIFLLVSGFFFWANVSLMSMISLQAAGNPMIAERINLTDIVIRPLIQNMAIILLFVTPLLTMRLFSEEKKSGTIELLLTYPIDDSAFVFGKFLAALALLLIMLLGTFTFPIFLASLAQPDLGVMMSGYLGLFLMGAAFMALGTFISSLTENQIVAGVITLGLILVLWLIDALASNAQGMMKDVLSYMSVISHLDDFIKGVIDTTHVIFYVTFAFFGLFLKGFL